MARYDWPRELRKSPDRLDRRAEQAARSRGMPAPSGLLGDLDDLDDVIQTNFESERVWVPLGPTILTNGQATGDPIVSGRTRAVHVNSTGTRIYVGSANGGVWYSNDSGASWWPVGSWGLAPTASRSDLSLTVGALLVEFGRTGAADDPAKDVVYVGTGEAMPSLSATPGDQYGGIGILRLDGTIDNALASPGGNPWTREARNLSGAGIFRLARDPGTALTMAGAGTLVAATSNGLWSRTGAFAEDADWQRVAFAPTDFDANDGAHCSDVVWNDRGLWVTLVGAGAEDGLYRSTTGTAGPFSRITLPNHFAGTRLSLGPAPHETRRMYVLGKIPPPINPANNVGLAHLWQVNLTHSTAAAVDVANFPVGLFTSAVTGTAPNFEISSDQADYDQAIAVTQSGTDDVVFAGGSLEDNGAWDAAIYRLTITGTAAAGSLTTNFTAANQTSPAGDGTFAGAGIHPDVHFLTVQGVNFWTGCDGGVFRTDSGGTAHSMNAGLATAQPGYITSHPTLDGPMLAGTQDNGAIQRIGNTVWRLLRKGDGGGCAYHPTKPHHTLMQYINATWRFAPAGFTPPGPVLRTNPTADRESTENDRASFYSQPVAAPTSNANQARVFVGTDRLWYSKNWDAPGTAMTWATIPTDNDPWNASNAANNIGQDRLNTGATDSVIAIDLLREGNAASNFDGMAILVLCRRTVRVFGYAHPAAAASGSWTTIANSIKSNRSGVDRPKQKKTADDVPNPFLDWLPLKTNSAWTDIAAHTNTAGSETFYVTTTGSVTVNNDGSLSADPNFDTLWWYNGAGRWYPTGLRNTPLNPGTGTGGCPASGHSVVVDPDDDRVVYVGTRIGVWEGRLDSTGTHPSWSWKPAMEGLPQALVEDLHVKRTTDGAFLRAALVSRGIWERDISVLPTSVGRTFIRSLSFDTGRTELPASPVNAETNAPLNYHSSPDIMLLTQAAKPWDPATPNEAQLMTAARPASYTRSTFDAYVMIHHRHTTPVAGGDVNIDLFVLRGAPAGSISGVTVAPIRQAIIDQVRTGSATFPAALSHVGQFHPASPVDARNSRAIRAPVDLSFAIQGAGPDDHVALIAVVTSPNNPFPASDLAPANLEEVVRRSGQIAVRKIRRI